MIDALTLLVDNGLDDETLDVVLDNLLENDEFDDDDDLRKCVALKWSRDNGDKTAPGDISDGSGDDICIGGAEYRILDDDEADTAFDDYLEQMLDEDGMVPGADSQYFDREAWKSDATIDGRGPSLSGYDGEEHELSIGSGDNYRYYYLYRTN